MRVKIATIKTCSLSNSIDLSWVFSGGVLQGQLLKSDLIGYAVEYKTEWNVITLLHYSVVLDKIRDEASWNQSVDDWGLLLWDIFVTLLLDTLRIIKKFGHHEYLIKQSAIMSHCACKMHMDWW